MLFATGVQAYPCGSMAPLAYQFSICYKPFACTDRFKLLVVPISAAVGAVLMKRDAGDHNAF